MSEYTPGAAALTAPAIPASLREDSADAVRKAMTIPGMYRSGEAAYLYRLALNKRVIVELGCYMGRSTSILLRAAKHSSGVVTSVDSFGKFSGSYKPSSKEKITECLASVGCVPQNILAMSTSEAARRWPKDIQIDMLFIDAAHDEESVLGDIEQWTPMVAEGGVLALHDFCQPNNPGVIRALGKWWTRKWRLHGLVDYTIAFTKDG